MNADTIPLAVINPDADPQSLEAKQPHIDNGTERYGKEGVGVVVSQREGNPAKSILAKLEAGNYGLAVTGSHGRRGIKRWLLGSVSERIVQLAPCSVLVVRGETD